MVAVAVRTWPHPCFRLSAPERPSLSAQPLSRAQVPHALISLPAPLLGGSPPAPTETTSQAVYLTSTHYKPADTVGVYILRYDPRGHTLAEVE